MKRIILSVVALSMLAATSLTGQAAPLNAPNAPQSNYSQVDWQKPGKNVEVKKRVVKKRVVKKPGKHVDVKKRVVKKPGRHVDVRERVVKKQVVVRKEHWQHGQKYSSWKRHQPIRDYGRYGLRRPGPGQEWIRVGNDYLLVSIVSGIIFGAIAAQ